MTTPTVADSLRLDHGVPQAEFSGVVAILGRLDERLRSFPAGTVELRLSVTDRDAPGQRMTLEAHIAGQPRLVAISERPEFEGAVAEVRDDLIRLISDAKAKTQPQNNRSLRTTI